LLGIYELLLIQKKSLPLSEYRKKVLCFNDITDQKSIEEVEDLFWKNISFSPPLYGADIKGSIMDPGVQWNLGELDSVLSKGLPRVISGVNVPYLYIGSWKTMFGWHKEDLDLYSINYLHHGKPKFWYALPKNEGKKLERFAKECFTDGFSKCSEFLRHKTVMINPYLLKKNIDGLKIHK
jgi:jumonji domain-containing protein 2